MNSKHMMTMACAVAVCGSVRAELTWNVTDGVSLGGYVAYTDYLFDSSLRHRARDYEATGHWTDSWNFTAGVSLSASF